MAYILNRELLGFGGGHQLSADGGPDPEPKDSSVLGCGIVVALFVDGP